MNKQIYIIGPTSSGKTSLAVHIASIFNCEIISADSRQVYKHMDVGTGKDLKEYGNIKYHCIDLIDPKTEFNLAKYLIKAKSAIKKIESQNKTPLIVGGTGLYINSLSQGYNILEEKIDGTLRKELNIKTKEELQKILLNLDKSKKLELNNSDWNNPHRLIRHIEKLKNNYPLTTDNCPLTTDNNSLIIGISIPKELLHSRIHKRIIDRIKNEGMIGEIYNLHHKHNVSWKRLESFGLEYKFISQYLQTQKGLPKELPEKVINLLATATNQYAKRQITWFKKTFGVIWLDGSDKNKLYQESEKVIKEFLEKK